MFENRAIRRLRLSPDAIGTPSERSRLPQRSGCIGQFVVGMPTITSSCRPFCPASSQSPEAAEIPTNRPHFAGLRHATLSSVYRRKGANHHSLKFARYATAKSGVVVNQDGATQVCNEGSQWGC